MEIRLNPSRQESKSMTKNYKCMLITRKPGSFVKKNSSQENSYKHMSIGVAGITSWGDNDQEVVSKC